MRIARMSSKYNIPMPKSVLGSQTNTVGMFSSGRRMGFITSIAIVKLLAVVSVSMFRSCSCGISRVVRFII